MKIDTTILNIKERKYLEHTLQSKSILFGIVELTKVKYDKFIQGVSKLRADYPLDYLVGEIQFLGRRFIINESVLIPRQETEYFVEQIIKDTAQEELLIDIGTGSGVIGISLAKKYKKVICVDISKPALETCTKNIMLNNIANIEALQSYLLADLQLQKKITDSKEWSLIANLPYLPEKDKVFAYQNKVSYEPKIALYSGSDGLDLLRKLVIQLNHNKLPKNIYLELDSDNVKQGDKYIQKLGYITKIINDVNGVERFIVGNLTTP